MTDLEKNINHYMDIKGIKMYTHLLVAIAHELGIKGQKAYDFANQEKANFSKMLKGQRPLKYEFIIPLEKIFGVSLARMKNPNSYKLPLDKDNIPYSKGFRYYAYLDDPELYKKELVNLLTKTGENTLTQTDEFGKTFLDYVVEYNSINGIRFLKDTYHLKLKFGDNQFDTVPKGMFWVNAITKDTLKGVRIEDGYIGVNPETANPTIKYSEDERDIDYNLMVLETKPLIKTENQDLDGGTYRLVTYILNNGAEYEIKINNGRVIYRDFNSYQEFRFDSTPTSMPDVFYPENNWFW